jgi:DNA primase
MEKLIQLLEKTLGTGRATSKGNYAFHCPFCNHQKRKLEINISSEHKEYHCWTCNTSGKKLITLFKKLNQSRETITELFTILNISVYYTDKTSSETAVVQSVRLPNEYRPLYRNYNSIEQKNALKYLLRDRQLSMSEIIKYNLGYCETGQYSKMIIVPSYDIHGGLNYFVGRSYYKTDGYKHKNPDTPKNIIGFELFINWNLPIVLVEGSFDAMAVRRNAIPLFGKTISEQLRMRIIERHVKDIYICLDKDAQVQALEHAEEFMNNGINVYFVNLQEKDPSEIGFETMCKVIADTKPLTFLDLIQYKLDL